MMIRTFIALQIPDPVLDEIIKIRDGVLKNSERFRWESKDKLHVTLKFLGDTDDFQVTEIFTKLKKESSKYSKFNLSLSHFGFLKSNGVPRILWTGLKENLELEKFVNEIDILCSGFGFEREKRKFKPHITLLRIKNEKWIEELTALTNYKLQEISFISNKITMFQSQLTKSGSIYKPLESFLI